MVLRRFWILSTCLYDCETLDELLLPIGPILGSTVMLVPNIAEV